MTSTASAPSWVDELKTLDCIHCGLCLNTCPTYRLSGVEASSPRGRIHLMRSAAEGRLEPDADFAEEMDFCLVCRHCESVCPAGVRFGEMMEETRDALGERLPRAWHVRALRWLGFRLVLPSRVALRLLATGLHLLQWSRVTRLLAKLPSSRARALAEAPLLGPPTERRLLPERTPARGEAPELVVNLLEGCVAPEFFGRANRATVQSLSALGVEVHVPQRVVCCGALHAHNGDLQGARQLARRLIAACERQRDEAGELRPLVVNSAGCGAHLKSLGSLFPEDASWRSRAEKLAASVRDFSELVEPLLAESSRSLVAPGLPSPLTWDDPCHLCHGQKIRTQPRELLDRLTGVDRVELEDSESCCGSAGLYQLLRPTDSQAVLEPKLEALERSGARALVTANPGCQMQWRAGIERRGLDVRVLHLAEVVAEALGERPD